MSDTTKSAIGSIGWIDLSIDDASGIRDFYQTVVGWDVEESPMRDSATDTDYADYTMSTSTGEPVAGVCHTRGTNAGLPAQWLMYLTVANLDTSVADCRRLGGEIIKAPRNMGSMGRFAIIRDPAGAACALFESA